MTTVHIGRRLRIKAREPRDKKYRDLQPQTAKKRPLVGQRIVRVAQDADAIARKKAGAKDPSLPKLKFLEGEAAPSGEDQPR